MEIISAEGKRQSHVTDKSWKYSEQEPEGNDWKTKGLSDGQESTIAGKAGDAPWKNIPLKSNELSELHALAQTTSHSRRSLVMQERPADNPRPTYLRHRGEYTSPKHEVHPKIPEILLSENYQDAHQPLGICPLAGQCGQPIGDRVTVNRAWRLLFGYGLIRTSGDFGTQAPAPDHPELLDWLAVEFRKNGTVLEKASPPNCDQCHLPAKLHCLSRASGERPTEPLAGTRSQLRLSGELIRDHMLHASGKLSSKMYGPGVYPPQPKTVLSHAFGNQSLECIQRGRPLPPLHLYFYQEDRSLCRLHDL